jgi:hypothetical protein
MYKMWHQYRIAAGNIALHELFLIKITAFPVSVNINCKCSGETGREKERDPIITIFHPLSYLQLSSSTS